MLNPQMKQHCLVFSLWDASALTATSGGSGRVSSVFAQFLPGGGLLPHLRGKNSMRLYIMEFVLSKFITIMMIPPWLNLLKI